MHPSHCLIIATASLTATTAATLAQPVLLDAPADRDRWMYPFNGTPGTRFTASVFGATLIDGFDDRDAQFILGWDTASTAPTGLAPESYVISSITVRAWISDGDRFFYDDSTDPVQSYYTEDDPEFVADTDPGRPVELWAVGYRDGFDLLSWEQTSPFSVSAPDVEPAQGNRVAFAAVHDAGGVAIDVSNNVKDRFEAVPAAIGTAPVALGNTPSSDTEFTFELDLCQPGVRDYVQRSLAEGRLNFAIAGLHPATFDPDTGPGQANYPIWYTRENPLAQVLGYQPRIELSVQVIDLPDFDASGTVNILDVVAFINAWQAQDPTADLDGNCQFNVFDVVEFIALFNAFEG